MAYVLQFPTFTEFENLINICDRDNAISRSQIFTWLTYGKLSESVTVVPLRVEQSITASGSRRYLDEVIVEPIKPSTATVTLATGATMTLTVTGVGKVESSAPAYATAKLSTSTKTVTITGVAAGTSVVTVYDTNNDLVTTITVVVS